MATSSFYENMVIDTPEAAANLERAFWEYKAREALGFNDPKVRGSGKKAREFFDNNPGWLENFIANAKEEMRKECLAQTDEEREMEERCYYDSPLVIDAPEAAANLERAFWEGKAREALGFNDISSRSSKKAREFFENNPGWLENFIANAKEEMRKEDQELPDDEGWAE